VTLMIESENPPPSNSANTPSGGTGTFAGAEAEASAGIFTGPGLIHVSDQPRPDPPPFQRDYRQTAPFFFVDQNEPSWPNAVQQNLRNSAAIPIGPVAPPYVPAERPGQVASDASAIEEEADRLEDAPRNVVIVAQEAPRRTVVHPGIIATETDAPEIKSEPATESAPQTNVSIPQQVATASHFSINETTGRIDLVLDSPDLAMLADPMERDLYAEVRHKALALSALGGNQLGDLSGPSDQLLAATPERIEDVSIVRLWSRGNTLRRRLHAHEIAVVSSEPFDPARLTPLVAQLLGDLIETFNVFIAGDPTGRELDRVRLGPQDRNAAIAIIRAAVPIVEAVKASEGLATTVAKEALVEQVGAVLDVPPGIDGDQAIDLAGKTTGNFVIKLLRIVKLWFAWKGIHAGLYRVTGPTALLYHNQIVAFVVDNADKLKVFVEAAFHDPALVQMIDEIARAFAVTSTMGI
jgi:hypothetical protein